MKDGVECEIYGGPPSTDVFAWNLQSYSFAAKPGWRSWKRS